MAKKMLIDLQRCVGCWTCAMACKVGNGLEDDDYRIIVRTNGSGAGIDRPQGTYPNLRMGWQPIYQKSCTFCAQNVADGVCAGRRTAGRSEQVKEGSDRGSRGGTARCCLS